MSTHQYKDTINNSWDNMAPLESQKLNTADTKFTTQLKCKKYLKNSIMNMIEVHKKKMNKSYKEIQEKHKEQKEINKSRNKMNK